MYLFYVKTAISTYWNIFIFLFALLPFLSSFVYFFSFPLWIIIEWFHKYMDIWGYLFCVIFSTIEVKFFFKSGVKKRNNVLKNKRWKWASSIVSFPDFHVRSTNHPHTYHSSPPAVLNCIKGEKIQFRCDTFQIEVCFFIFCLSAFLNWPLRVRI